MRKLIFMALCLISFASFGQKAKDDFTGKWRTENQMMVDVLKRGNSFYGTAGPKIILDDLHYADGVWKGTFFRPFKNQKFECTAILAGDKMKITIKKGPVTETVTWTK